MLVQPQFKDMWIVSYFVTLLTKVAPSALLCWHWELQLGNQAKKILRAIFFKNHHHLGDEGWRNHFIFGPYITYDEPSSIKMINLEYRTPVFLDQNTLNSLISPFMAYIQKRVLLV